MRMLAPFLLTAALVAVEPANPMINQVGFLQDARGAMAARLDRRISAEVFLRMAREPGTVILDARSRDRFERLHVAGAVNLPFTDMTAESLAAVIPATGARILIYCNNNFANDPVAFAGKAPSASLNLSTWTALRSYGYRNIYELGPYLDATDSPIPLVAGRDGASPTRTVAR